MFLKINYHVFIKFLKIELDKLNVRPSSHVSDQFQQLLEAVRKD